MKIDITDVNFVSSKDENPESLNAFPQEFREKK